MGPGAERRDRLPEKERPFPLTSDVPSRTVTFRWFFFLSYSIFLLILFILPPEQIPEEIASANDKLLHFLDFFLLALLAFQAFASSSRPIFSLQAGLKAASFSFFYGAFLEWLQLRVPGREGSFADWLADAAGILVASGIFRISRLTRPV